MRVATIGMGSKFQIDFLLGRDLNPSKSSDGRRDRRLGGQGHRDEGDTPEPGMFPPVSRCGHQGTVCQSEGSQRLPCRLSCQEIETEQAAWDV